MFFTLIFPGDRHGPKATYNLVFHPLPIWMKDGNEIINPGKDSEGKVLGGVEYKLGYLQGLIDKEELSPNPNPNVAICVHPGGHGTEKDLESLLEDLANSSFEPTVVTLGNM